MTDGPGAGTTLPRVTSAVGAEQTAGVPQPKDDATSLGREGSRRGDIQGLRGIAVLAVVLYHAGAHAPGGFTGVDVFFAISGFVITGTLLRQLVARDRLHLGGFYLRRIKRLLPAFATMTVVVAAVGVLATAASALRLSAVTGAAASLFFANVYLFHVGSGYFDISTSLDPFLHTWTLGVEEQFYVVFPAALVATWWLARRRLRAGHGGARLLAALVFGVASLASFALAVALSSGPVGGALARQKFAFYGSPTRAWEFGLGAVCALLVPWLARIPAVVATLLGAAGLAAIAGSIWLIHGTSHTPGISTLLPVAGTCAAIVCGTASGRGVPRLLAFGPLAWIGDLSYSWYLWHWPAIVYAHSLWPAAAHAGEIAAAVSLLPAWLSFRYVENPIRFRLPTAPRPVLAVGLASVGLALLACGGLWAANRAIAPLDTVAAWKAGLTPHADTTRGCAGAIPFGPSTPRRCTMTVPRARGEIVLVGDSNAGQYSEPVFAAARQARYDAVVTTAHACPFAYLTLTGSLTTPSADCRRYLEGTLRAVAARRPSLVIVAERTDEYLTNFELGFAPPAGGPSHYDPPAKSKLLEAGLGRALRELSAAHVPVVLVHPVPILPLPSTDCAVIRILTHGCASTVPRASVERELRPAVALENSAAAGASTVSPVSFVDAICGRSECRSTRGRMLMYRDLYHLTIAGSLTLTSRFYRLIVDRAVPRT